VMSCKKKRRVSFLLVRTLYIFYIVDIYMVFLVDAAFIWAI